MDPALNWAYLGSMRFVCHSIRTSTSPPSTTTIYHHPPSQNNKRDLELWQVPIANKLLQPATTTERETTRGRGVVGTRCAAKFSFSVYVLTIPWNPTAWQLTTHGGKDLPFPPCCFVHFLTQPSLLRPCSVFSATRRDTSHCVVVHFSTQRGGG